MGSIWLDMDSHSVRMKRTGSRKCFKCLPDLVGFYVVWRDLESFLEVAHFRLTEYEPISSHMDPTRSDVDGF